MKGRSNRLPTSDPPDDWVNGSWTVDCICGVNFDDGEEMVNCDECGVWVHTRCSRFVRGEKSFACDKCKSKASRNDSEETEVAQLLVELPTKTIRMNNPYPLNNPPPPPPRPPYRLWTDRPIEERVHVQGIPGGDPSLFQGFPLFLSSELWKCSGYVPKKFNFCYREFPCWDKQQGLNAKTEGDTEITVDKGAGVLYSLSKQTEVTAHAPTLVSMRGQAKDDASDKNASNDSKWDGKNFSVQNLSKKEKSVLRPIVLRCSKRSRDDLASSGKKKIKAIRKQHDGKKDKLHAFKTVVIHSTYSRQAQVYESKAQKVASNAPPIDVSNVEEPSHDDTGHGQKCSKTEDIHLPSVEKDGIVRHPLKKEGLVLDVVDKNQGAHSESPTSDLQKSKLLVEDVANAAVEIKNTDIATCVETIMPLTSGLCINRTKSDANVDNPKSGLRSHAPDIDAQSDGVKYFNELVLSLDQECDNSKLNEAAATSSKLLEHEGRDSDKGLEAVSGRQFEKDDEIIDCTKLECEGSENFMEKQKPFSDSKETTGVTGETSKLRGAVPLPSSSHHKTVSVGKPSPSSSIAIARSSLSDKNRTANSQNSSSIGKRVVSNSGMSTKKEKSPVAPVMGEDKHEKPKSMIKDHPKTSAHHMSKASQPSRTITSPVHKHYTSVGKDFLRHPSAKASSVESSLFPSGTGESTGSLQTQHALHGQNKNMASGGQQRVEKVTQSNLQSSSKSNLSSLGHPPPSSSAPAGLSDEELALLLHQELNSSPRVPRVPRVRHAGSLPQLSSASATSMLVKRTSSSGGKDQYTFSRRKNKDAHKDAPRSFREQDSDAKKVDKAPSSPDSVRTSDALTQAEGNSESIHSVRKKVEQISISATNSCPSSTDANELKFSTQDLPVYNPEDDTGTNKGLAPTHRTLPGLIAEIMGTGKRMTYEELCNAVLPHWQNLRKHNGERYAYSSHSQAVLDCLRNRTEWARLVDRGPKTNASRKKRKVDVEPPNTESDDSEDRPIRDGESKSFESHKEEFPKGRRNARQHRRLALRGRGVKDDRKRRKVEGGSNDSGSLSNSRGDSASSEDDSQGSGISASKSEVSASTDDDGDVAAS